jgi:hypothetical protein
MDATSKVLANSIGASAGQIAKFGEKPFFLVGAARRVHLEARLRASPLTRLGASSERSDHRSESATRSVARSGLSED